MENAPEYSYGQGERKQHPDNIYAVETGHGPDRRHGHRHLQVSKETHPQFQKCVPAVPDRLLC